MESPPEMHADGERRWRRLAVAPDILIDLAKATEWVTLRVQHNPLPADARLIRVYQEPSRDTLYLVIESATFEPLRDYQMIPELYPPTFRRWWGSTAPAPPSVEADE